MTDFFLSLQIAPQAPQQLQLQALPRTCSHNTTHLRYLPVRTNKFLVCVTIINYSSERRDPNEFGSAASAAASQLCILNARWVPPYLFALSPCQKLYYKNLFLKTFVKPCSSNCSRTLSLRNAKEQTQTLMQL